MSSEPAASSRFGLLPRFFVALVLVGLAPLAVVTVGLFEANTSAMREQVKTTHSVAVRATAARLEAYVASRTELGDSLARTELLIRDPRGESSLELLAATLRAQPRLVGIVMRNAAGETVVRLQRPDHGEIVDRVLRESTAAGVTALLDGESLWIGFVTELPEKIGSIHLVDDGAPLDEDIFHLVELGEDAELALVDLDGRRLLGRLEHDALPEELLQHVLSQKTFGANVFEGEDGETFVAALWPMSGAPWTVLSTQPGRVAEANAAQLRRRASVALGLSLALAGLVLFVTYRTVVQPLRGLLVAQARLEGLELSGGGNEIAQLKSSFNRIAERVRNKQELGKVFLGRYQVLELIGEGGMGAVFRGWDPKLQRLVALKTIRPDPQSDKPDSEQTSSLLSEAILAARFNHSNVVSVYDVEDTEGAAYIAMEFVDGDSLDRYRKEQVRVSPREAVPIGAAVARALAEAHSRGILHRDIKPGNVMLGFDHSIKVTDFGIASLVGSLDAGEQRVFGTPGYIAPEVILGETYRFQSDLFSLGVLLFEILAGKKPISGHDVRQVLVNTLQVRAAQIGQRLPPGPVELQRIVVRLLRRDPDERYASAAEAAEQLEELAHGHGWKWHFEGGEADRAPDVTSEPSPVTAAD